MLLEGPGPRLAAVPHRRGLRWLPDRLGFSKQIKVAAYPPFIACLFGAESSEYCLVAVGAAFPGGFHPLLSSVSGMQGRVQAVNFYFQLGGTTEILGCFSWKRSFSAVTISFLPAGRLGRLVHCILGSKCVTSQVLEIFCLN